jgi:hypothetical protein
MTTAEFWASTFERAVKTFAQAAVALIGTGAAGVTELDWQQIGSVALVAAIVSVLTSLASDRIGTPGPSLVKEAVQVPVEVTAAPFIYPDPEAPANPYLTAQQIPGAVDADELARRMHG